MSKFNSLTKACTLFLLWAAAAIALPAQTFATIHNFAGATTGKVKVTLPTAP